MLRLIKTAQREWINPNQVTHISVTPYQGKQHLRVHLVGGEVKSVECTDDDRTLSNALNAIFALFSDKELVS